MFIIDDFFIKNINKLSFSKLRMYCIFADANTKQHRTMQLITSLPLTMFSSQIPTLEFSDVGEEPVGIIVSCEGYEVLNTSIYPVGNRMYVHDLRILIEECMREHDLTYTTMEIEIGEYVWRLFSFCQR